jgi:hypothetical protein
MWLSVPEHHVELGKAKDKMIALVDYRDFDGIAVRFGQESREFEAAEASPEDKNLRSHT